MMMPWNWMGMMMPPPPQAPQQQAPQPPAIYFILPPQPEPNCRKNGWKIQFKPPVFEA